MAEDGIVQSATSHLMQVVRGATEKRGGVPGPSPNHPFLVAGYGRGTPNMKLLRAAVWYVDGVVLGLRDLPARRLRLLQLLRAMVPHCSLGGGTEILSATHSQLYYAAWGSILWAASMTTAEGEVKASIEDVWREELFLANACRLPDGTGIWAPGARARLKGKGPLIASNPGRDLAWNVVNFGVIPKKALSDHYNVGARFLWELGGRSDLLHTARPPKMPAAFHVRRESDGFAAWFDGLPALQPALAAGQHPDGDKWVSGEVPAVPQVNEAWSDSAERIDLEAA